VLLLLLLLLLLLRRVQCFATFQSKTTSSSKFYCWKPVTTY
jgi:hypothetical protein